MTKHNQQIGRWGEQAAVDYLEKRGYSIICRNEHTPHGEIDIVASIEGLTIFVEVKARTTNKFGFPEVSINYRKLAHMRACAGYYASQHEINHWQCDAIAVEGTPGTPPLIEHFENVLA